MISNEQSRPVLEVQGLKTYFRTADSLIRAVDDVSFRLRRGMVLGIVGESGCGKSVTASSILNIIPRPGKIIDGHIMYHSGDSQIDITNLNPHGKEMRMLRGGEIAMIFQEPMTAFSPVYSIGNQIAEAVIVHQNVNKQEARRRVIDMLGKVEIASPAIRVDDYPFEMSGGMRQRAMIAMALCCNPSVLIADEPTTALDMTTQATILALLQNIQNELEMATIFITHNLGVIADMADEVIVMYLGKVMEQCDVNDLFNDPMHPYTRGLLMSLPLITSGRKQKLVPIQGSVPDPREMPLGCPFAPRCSFVMDKCDQMPPLAEERKNHLVRCWLFPKG